MEEYYEGAPLDKSKWIMGAGSIVGPFINIYRGLVGYYCSISEVTYKGKVLYCTSAASGVENNVMSEVKVNVNGNNISLRNASASTTVSLFTVDGRLIDNTCCDGEVHLTAFGDGVYM